jgi:DNA-binding FrmR family transcriptional regulator
MSPRKTSATSKSLSEPTAGQRNEILRLSRIRGQIDGIERMIKDDRYCPDIMNQIRSAASALRSIEGQLMQRHLKDCVADALRSKRGKERDKKIRELMDLFGR